MTQQEALEQKEWDMIRGFLEKATPEEWHVFAASSNYDGNNNGISWLVDNPKIDTATALLIYWYLGAAWFVQYASEEEVKADADYSLEPYRMLRLLEKRYAEGFYSDYGIRFDPMESEGGHPEDYPDIPVKNPIPGLMLQAVGTKPVELFPDGYDEGIPEDMYAAILEMYRALDA